VTTYNIKSILKISNAKLNSFQKVHLHPI